MSRTKAQPLPSLVGEGQGWGQYLIRYQDITDPTQRAPLPVRAGFKRGVAGAFFAG